MIYHYTFLIGPLIFFGFIAYGQYRKWKALPGKTKRAAETPANIVGIVLGGPLVWASLLVYSKLKAKGRAKYKALLKAR